MRTSLRNKFNLILVGILGIGLLMGILFLIFNGEASREIIFSNINNYLQDMSPVNGILYHILILSSLLISSFLIIGIPLSVFFLFYNGFSIGFIVTALTSIFGTKGLVYGIIYVIITKGLFILLLLLYIKSLIKISGVIIDRIINKESIKEKIYYLIIRCIVIIGIVLFIDILLYFFGVSILNIFNFLII